MDECEHSEQETAENGEQTQKEKRKKKNCRKPKPWDNEGIDHWKIEKWDPSWNEGGLLEVSAFSTLFPQYREDSLQEEWPMVKSALKEYGIKGELNLVERSMTVSTTKKTRGPYIIIKARDLIRLLSRSVPASQVRLVKRRWHLTGANDSATLKALEAVTGCYLLVRGNTVAAMGSFKGLKQIRNVVEDCMMNKLHPVCNIKILMMKNELAKVPFLANENWDRFLPKFKKKSVKQKKVKTKKKKPYTPSPPPESVEVDIELETGESSGTKKSSKKRQEKLEKQAEKKRKRE